MVYRGKVHNGQVVVEGALALPEGTELEILPVPSHRPRIGSAEAILPFAGIWADQAEEMDRSLAELRAMKEEEVRRQLAEPDDRL